MYKEKEEKFFVRCLEIETKKTSLSPDDVDDVVWKKRDRYLKSLKLLKKNPDLTTKPFDSVTILFTLPLPLEARFMGVVDGSSEEIIEVESGKRKGYFVRGSPLSVSTSRGSFYFCIPIYPELSNRDIYLLTDRGLCWVYPDKHKAKCYLTFVNWHKEHWRRGEVAEIIRKARKQVINEVEKALNSKFDFNKIKKSNK